MIDTPLTDRVSLSRRRPLRQRFNKVFHFFGRGQGGLCPKTSDGQGGREVGVAHRVFERLTASQATGQGAAKSIAGGRAVEHFDGSARDECRLVCMGPQRSFAPQGDDYMASATVQEIVRG